MDFIIDFISDYFYIILVIGSLIANSAFFTKKKEEVEPTEEDLARERRAAEIREEIKRRIAGAQQNKPATKTEQPYDPFTAEKPVSQPAQTPPPVTKTANTKSSQTKKSQPLSSAPLPNSLQYKKQVDQKMAEIRKINERAKNILAQNKTKIPTKTAQKTASSNKLAAGSLQEVVAFSKNPKLARQALIYHEIFSKPLALREENLS